MSEPGPATTEVSTTGSLGIYLSTDSIFENSTGLLPVVPQAQNPQTNIIDSLTGWKKIEMTFRSLHGNEEYLYIGNFNDSANTDVTVLYAGTQSTLVFIYIDDVSLTECGGVGVEEETSGFNLKIFPSPAHENVTLSLPGGIDNPQLLIYTIHGQLLRQQRVGLFETINITNLPNGLYLFAIQSNGITVAKEKIIIAH